MNFGENIKQLRTSANLTQSQLADKLGIKQSSYVSWEQKKSNPTLELLEKLSEIYQIPIRDIIEKNDIKSEESELLEHFRGLAKEQKNQLTNFALFLSQQKSQENQQLQTGKTTHLTNLIEFKTYKRNQLNYAIVEDEQLSAGYGNAVSNTGSKYKAYTPEHLSRYDGAARIKGESMEPDFPNFSIATFLKTGFGRSGEIYAISEGDLGEEQLYIKQVFQEENGFRIHSLNPKYKDFYLGEDDNFRIIGPVVDNFVEIEEEQIED